MCTGWDDTAWFLFKTPLFGFVALTPTVAEKDCMALCYYFYAKRNFKAKMKRLYGTQPEVPN